MDVLTDNTIINILWVEDSLETELLIDILDASDIEKYELFHVIDLKNAINEVNKKNIDVIILDLNLPDSKGLETVTKMHQSANNLPIIILTGYSDKTLALKALRIGAQDYLFKNNMNKNNLSRSIFYAIERKKNKEKLTKSNEELKIANEKLKSLEILKKEFISLISHELKTPIASIIGYAEILEECDFNKTQFKEFTKVIIEEGERLSGLINNVLDLSEMSSGSLEYRISEIKLDQMVFEVFKLLKDTAEKKDINFKFNPTGRGGQTIICDPDRIKQLLTNLLTNAIHFSPKKKAINISTKCDESFITISVINEGPLIPIEDLDKIFDKFYIREGKNAKGIGIGLAIAKYIVEAHNGSIKAENTKNGNKFSFKLPFNQK